MSESEKGVEALGQVDKGPKEEVDSPQTEVQIVAPSGILQTLRMSIHEPAAETMRRSLTSIGKEAKGVFIFALGATIIEEAWTLENLGVSEGSSIEVTVLDSLRPCFEWAFYNASGDNKILDQGITGSTFQRGNRSSHTDGVRTRLALPRDVLCYLKFGKTGTHTCLGVGTSNCELAATSYVHLFGQDENSWALCFGASGSPVTACHKGKSCDMQDMSGRLVEPTRTTEPLVLSFLISTSGQMRVTLPGQSEEIAVPFEIPQDLDLFVVASTVYADSTIAISSTPFQ